LQIYHLMSIAPTEYHFEIIHEPTQELREAINGELREFNRIANPVFWTEYEKPENEARPLDIFVFDQRHHVIGGLFAETQFLWLKCSIMSVQKEFRRSGIGTQLMAMAEAEAVRRGCKYGFVDTMEYQAPQFYLKLGYRIAGQLHDWDSHGHSKFFLTKELT